MDKSWKAHWIIDPDFSGLKPMNVFHKELSHEETPNHPDDLKNIHTQFRKKFSIQSEFNQAFLDITADDYYKVYINGQFVGQGPAPSYHFHYYYNRYDIKDYLVSGENVIAVHVYYQGLINRVWNSGDYRQGMIAELFLDNEIKLYTDSTWKCSKALEFVGNTTIGYDTQFVEDIDHRLKKTKWREIDFNDQGWNHVVENDLDDHKLVLQPTPTLEIYEIKPQDIIKIRKGHYLIDFGQEITGQFKVAANGNEGQIVTIKCGEELEEDHPHRVRYELRCNCTYKEKWILSGTDDVLEHFDYKAFRYVEIEAPENVIHLNTIRAVVRHYPFDEQKCKFDSSNNLLNDIWEICKNGVKYGTQEVYVDCPTREKGQYLGDATVITNSHIYLSGDLRMFKKSLKDFALSTHICPGMMAVAPGSYMQEIADYSLQYPYQLLNYYRHSGDFEFLKEMYPIVEGIIDYFKKYQRPDGLLENVTEKWNLVDWPENLRDNYDFDLSIPVGKGCHNVINAFYIGAVKTLSEIRDILKINDDKDKLSRLIESYQQAFYNDRKKLFTDSTESSHTSLHANFLPLFWGLAPKDSEDSIVNLISEKKLRCGVYNAYFLLKGLAKAGAYDLVFDLIVSEDERSWANMLREGATTCFEAWGKEHKWNTSLCHPWASAPISVLIEDILGIQPYKPGWQEIQFNPQIPSDLDFISIQFETIKGKIQVTHQKNQTNITVPKECIVIE